MICADAGYGENGAFCAGLNARQIPYSVQVKSATSMHLAEAVFELPAYFGRGRPPVHASYRDDPLQAQDLGPDWRRRFSRTCSGARASGGR